MMDGWVIDGWMMIDDIEVARGCDLKHKQFACFLEMLLYWI